MSAATRLVRSSLLVSFVVLAAAPVARAHPAPRAPGDTASSCTPVVRTGTYRVTLTRDGAEPVPGLVVLERAAGCLVGLFVTETSSAPLYAFVVSGQELSAVMRTMKGKAKVVLRFDDAGVTGSIAEGRRQWSLQGERTS
ncbi:MAG TPA: hypothetical protein VEA99_09315 [Gemmatimonadaceae bacterium]|nr:hypothetical protein [Gemmatimonadaceae bacterium]